MAFEPMQGTFLFHSSCRFLQDIKRLVALLAFPVRLLLHVNEIAILVIELIL